MGLLSDENDLGAAALRYAELGWPVVPLHHVQGEGCSCGRADCSAWGKHPRPQGWQEAATCERGPVRAWWRKWPLANVGVRTGPPRGGCVGLVMIGPDGEQGLADLARLFEELGPLPDTCRALSGTAPGEHWVFLWPDDGGAPVQNSARHLGTGIDLRGEDGQFVVWPSRNAAGQYRWLVPPWEAPPAALPAEWLAWCRTRRKAAPPPPVPPAPPRAAGLKGRAGAGADPVAAYVEAAVRRETDELRGAAEGGRNDRLNEAAFSLGTLVGAGVLSEGRAAAELEAAALACGLDPGEVGPTIRSGLGAGRKAPRDLSGVGAAAPAPPGRPRRLAGPAAGESPRPAGKWAFTLDGQTIAEGDPLEVTPELDLGGGEGVRLFELRTLANLLNTEFPAPVWVVPGLLSEGLNILGGAPKQGKSMLSLNLALTVAGGGKAMGSMPVLSGDVLYLSLEDMHRRVQARARQMLTAHAGADWRGEAARRLTVATAWPRQDEGGINCLELWLRRAETPRLVIIDVWNRFAPAFSAKGANAYTQDAEAMAQLKHWADRRGVCVLVVHHTRKPGLKEPADFIHEISGTLGLSGTADGILCLVRCRGENEATLYGTGRDVGDLEIVLQFDEPTLSWRSLGSAEQHLEGAVEQAVVDYLRSLAAGQGAFTADIAEGCGQKYDSVRKALSRLLGRKIIRRRGNAWSYPADADDERENTSESPF